MNQELIYDVSEKEIEGKPYMRLRSSTHEFYFWKIENVSEKDLMVLNSVVEYLSTPKYGTFVRVGNITQTLINIASITFN
jgi:hypothetical protein